MYNFSFRKNDIILLLLGFSSGLPFSLVSTTLQAWLTIEKIDLKTISFFALVGQAYVFKFFWSPIIDCYAIPFFGRRQGWLFVSQILLIISITLMSFTNPSDNLSLLAILAMFVAFFSASQDIVFDAWKTDVLLPEERANGAAISVLGYRLAMLISGGLALWLADFYLGWQSTYRLMAFLMIPGVITTLYAKDSNQTFFKPINLKQAVVSPLSDFFKRNNAWLIISLIILYKLGDAFSTNLTNSFLIRGIGFDAGEVGLMNKTLGLLAIITGIMYGNTVIKKLNTFYALMIFGTLQAVSNLNYCILSLTGKQIYSMAFAIFMENICGIMGTAAFVALLMMLCNKSFSATQFALLSAVSAIGRVYIGTTSGWLVNHLGWSEFYAFSVIAAIPGLLLLAKCKNILEYSQNNINKFIPRTKYNKGYNCAFIMLTIGFIIIILWLFMLTWNSINIANIKNNILICVLTSGILFIICSVITGSILDCLAIRNLSLNKKKKIAILKK